MSELPNIQVSLAPKKPTPPPVRGPVDVWIARNGALCLFASAWILIFFLATAHAPIFGRHSHATPTDRTPFPEQSRFTWGKLLFNSTLGAAGLTSSPEGSKPENISQWWDDIFYHCSFFFFVVSPLYFALRRHHWIVCPWALVSVVLFTGFWWSGEHSLDRLPTSGIYRPYTLWGFYGIGIAMALMTAAMLTYEYACWREFAQRRNLSVSKTPSE